MREMVNSELGKEIKKFFFRLVTSVGQRKDICTHHRDIQNTPDQVTTKSRIKLVIKSFDLKLSTPWKTRFCNFGLSIHSGKNVFFTQCSARVYQET